MGSRREALVAALAARFTDPLDAAEGLARMGPGAELERTRLEAWLGCLERAEAPPAAWRALLADGPPADVATRARLGLVTTLLAVGDARLAESEVAALGPERRPAGDELLLLAADEDTRLKAARRLAVADPPRLRRRAPELEGEATGGLDHDGWLRRAAAWRAAGAPERAAAELRRRRWRGRDEELRRLELARSEIDAGAAGRALAALPGGAGAAAEEELLRARALRLRGWGRVPGAAAAGPFRECLRVARSVAGRAGEERTEALELVLECATEAGDLDAAAAAWQDLAAAGWEGPRRSWLGRRLGVALARAGSRSDVVGLAVAVPEHGRCLRYWAAVASTPPDVGVLADLAAAGVADLYGQWARARLGETPPDGPVGGPPLPPTPPPDAVRWLLDLGESELAIREWRRLRSSRGSTPGEALLAAAAEMEHGSANQAIRWLREGFDDLGEVGMGDAPRNALEAYLPLPWPDAVRDAARSAGVDPWLVAGVARQESVFVPSARSPAGAVGVMQLVQGTARPHALALGLGSRPRLEVPEVSLRLGARELARLLRRFGATEPAVAAYNAGEARAARWWRRWPEPTVFSEAIPIPETSTYVRRVVFLAEGYRRLYADRWRESP